MDIGLDCFPHNSGTTLFEHLYMGIPYITLKDRPSVGRLGCAILAGVGHPEWAAENEEEYIEKAVQLTGNLDRLSRIRSGLRKEMENSPLMDEVGFTAKVENAYIHMFDKWYSRKNNAKSEINTLEDQFRTAEEFFAENEYDLAGNIYMDILKNAPDNPHAHYRLGSLAVVLGQPETALPYFQKAVDLAPEQGQYWLSYIDALDECGNSETAMELLEMAVQAGLSDNSISDLRQKIAGNFSGPSVEDKKFEIDPDEEKQLITLFQQEKYAECEDYARTLLKRCPEYPLGCKALGLALHGEKKSEEAIPVLQKAISLAPKDLELYHLLAEIYIRAGQLTKAEECYLDSLRHLPQAAESWFGLAIVQAEQDRNEMAKSSYLKSLELNPNLTDAYVNLGNLFQREGDSTKAEECFIKAQHIACDYAAPFFNHANLMREQGHLNEAEKLYLKTIEIDPNHLQAYSNLGITLQLRGRLQDAEKWYEKALHIRPDFIEALINSGACLKEQGYYRKSENRYKSALKIQPDFTLCLSNLGSVLKEQGKIEEAEFYLRKAVELNPDFSEAHSNLLFLLNYHPDKTPEEIFAEYHRYNQKFGTPRDPVQPAPLRTRRDLKKHPLKLGYVSPQFKRHSTLHFLEPLLANHDRDTFEIFAYAEQTEEDEYSKRYRSYIDHWIPTVNLNDDQLAARIRNDEIDILIDIAGHTAHNRLLMFTRKPAPVSLHWLDFGYTTGLTAIDYYVADEAIVPTGTDHLFSEKIWRVEPPVLLTDLLKRWEKSVYYRHWKTSISPLEPLPVPYVLIIEQLMPGPKFSGR
ncbi:hypothetical protein DGMP_12560 [Desulfomarina profundi]|uniref:O-GlcNAc transferase C-terminal domain-containing protein n=1 Tax=Desulfomarina profundi TaxID=2772557 RepID=A0A8D5FKB1_9BACT|nr:tetratricopeptide repeat protein [Desulfomarina profundi]BCL60563.1 hypothetical protein DGMP_12560 [Desulfomarina profundi]